MKVKPNKCIFISIQGKNAEFWITSKSLNVIHLTKVQTPKDVFTLFKKIDTRFLGPVYMGGSQPPPSCKRISPGSGLIIYCVSACVCELVSWVCIIFYAHQNLKGWIKERLKSSIHNLSRYVIVWVCERDHTVGFYLMLLGFFVWVFCVYSCVVQTTCSRADFWLGWRATSLPCKRSVFLSRFHLGWAGQPGVPG